MDQFSVTETKFGYETEQTLILSQASTWGKAIMMEKHRTTLHRPNKTILELIALR